MDDLNKKAVDLLLRGATLVAEPCPYCKGVRIMKDGNALCIREPGNEKITQNHPKHQSWSVWRKN